MAFQTPLDQIFVISIWLEAVLYGFLVCLFFASLFVNLTLKRNRDVHGKVMFGISCFMFFLATIHIAMNCFRLIQGYVIHASEPGGPAAFLGVLSTWHHIFKDVVYATQEMLGDAVAIYRTWVIWSRDWRAVALCLVLLVVQIVSGYSVCGLYPSIDPTASIFDPRLLQWISTFYAISFIQSFLTTFLMAYRLGMADHRAAKYRVDEGALLPVLRILVESAALQLVIEFILLILYACNNNAQYILLETVTPAVAITFNAITIRIAIRSSETLSSRSQPSQPAISAQQQQSTGISSSIPMHPITINIKQDVEAHGDNRSENEVNFDRK